MSCLGAGDHHDEKLCVSCGRIEPSEVQLLRVENAELRRENAELRAGRGSWDSRRPADPLAWWDGRS